MAPTHPPTLVYRGECEKNRDCLKNDLNELITQERDDRKEGEIELEKGIERVETQIQAMNSKLSGLLATLLIAVIIAVLELLFGKI